jgi:hypothetical protein
VYQRILLLSYHQNLTLPYFSPKVELTKMK